MDILFGEGENIFDEDVAIEDTLYVPQTHLDSPLSDDIPVMVLRRDKDGKKFEREFQAIRNATGLSRSQYATNFHKILWYLMSLYQFLDPEPDHWYTSTVGLVKQLTAGTKFEGVFSRLSDGHRSVLTRKWRSYDRMVAALNEFRARFLKESKMADDISGYDMKFGAEELEFYVTKNLVSVGTKHGYYLVEHNTLLMWIDLVQERARIYEACDVGHSIEPDYYMESARIHEYFREGDKIIQALGNSGYSAVKMWEPLVTGTLHTKIEKPVTDKTKFYNLMVQTFEDELRGVDCKWVEMLSVETVPHLGEYLGMHRLWGHPFTYHLLGVEKNKTKSMHYTQPDPDVLKRVVAKFKEMIVRNYYTRFGHYPNLDLSRLMSKVSEESPDETVVFKHPIIKAIRAGIVVDYTHPAYDPIDWYYLEGKKTFDNDLTLSTLNVLKDKSCSPSLSQLKDSIVHRRPVDPLIKRTLANFLNNNYPDPSEYLKAIDKNGIPKEHLLIGLAKKERELNPAPRLFSLMTIPLKFYFGYTEDLIATNLVPLVKECTMKDSLPELMDKIVNNVVMSKKTQEVVVYLGLDFEKWNLQFRHTNTYPFFQFMDQLHGYGNLISRTHKIFEKCVFYAQDRNHHFEWDHNIDSIKRGPLVWSGQLGGCEGLRQKGWTLVTIAMLKTVLDARGVKFSIMGQGDNQTIALRLRPRSGRTKDEMTQEDRDDIRQQVESILDEIIQISRSFRLPLKKEETWVSGELFSYGKNLYYNGVPLRCTLKRICRMFPYANEDYPSIATGLSSVSAAAQAAVAQSDNIVVPYYMAVEEGSRLIKRHLYNSPMFSKGDLIRKVASRLRRLQRVYPVAIRWIDKLIKGDTTIDTLIFGFLLGCNTLGGSPFCNVYDLVVRGTNDKLSQHITYLSQLLKSGKLSDDQKQLAENLLCPVMDLNPDKALLLEDPESIPILSGVSSKNILKRATRYLFSSTNLVRNSLVSSMLKADLSDRENIINFLWSVEPLAPAVLGSIYKATTLGLVDNLVNKFDTTRTMIKLARKHYNIATKLSNSEVDTIANWIGQLKTKGQVVAHACPTRIAQGLRNIGWKREILGVTNPCTYHLYDLREKDHPEFITCNLSSRAGSRYERVIREIGPCYPQLGSETKEKLEQSKEWEVKSLPPMIKSATQIMRIINWIFPPEDNMCEFLRSNLRCFTDIESKYFEVKPHSVTGNFVHRFHDDFRTHGGYVSTLITANTHMMFNTNTMGQYSRGGTNYSLHFQQIIVAFSSLLSHKMQFWPEGLADTPRYYIQCKDCLEPLPDQLKTKLPPIPLHANFRGTECYYERDVIVKAVISKVQLNSKRSLDSYTNKQKQGILYEICGRALAGNLFREKTTKLPVNWFFNVDLERLFFSARSEALTFQLIDVIESGFIELEKNEFTIYDLEIKLKNRIASSPNGIIDSMINIFATLDNLELLSRSPKFRDFVPINNPPSTEDIRRMIRDCLDADWDYASRCPTLCSGELSPYKMFLYICAKILLLSEHIVISRNLLLTILRTKQKLKDLMHVAGDHIIDDNIFLVAYSLVSFGMNKPEVTMFYYKLKKYLEYICFTPYGTDKVIKSIEKEAQKESSIPKRVYAFITDGYQSHKCSSRGSRSDLVPEKVISPIRHLRQDLSTTHGPCLLSMLNKYDDDGNDWAVIGDGGGGTSLALSLVVTTKIYIIPYLRDQDLVLNLFDSSPPEVRKHNPHAPVLMAMMSSVSMGNPDSYGVIKDMDHSNVLIDMDMKPEDLDDWLISASYISSDSKLYLLYSHFLPHQFQIVLGKMLKAFYIKEVRRSKIIGSNSWLVVATTKCVYNPGGYIPSAEVNEVHENTLSYENIEGLMLNGSKSCPSNMYRWITPYTNENIIRSCLASGIKLNTRNEHSPRRYLYQVLSYKVATEIYWLVKFVTMCGSFESRVERIMSCREHETLRLESIFVPDYYVNKKGQTVKKVQDQSHYLTKVTIDKVEGGSFIKLGRHNPNHAIKIKRFLRYVYDTSEHKKCVRDCWTQMMLS